MGLNWRCITDGNRLVPGSLGGRTVGSIDEADEYLKEKFQRDTDEEIGWFGMDRWEFGPIYMAILRVDENTRWEAFLLARDEEV